MGPRIRELKGARKPMEPYIKRQLQQYIKWSQIDGGYHNMKFLPVILLVAGKRHHSIERITKNTKDQLNVLAQKHRDYLALQSQEQLSSNEQFRRTPPIVHSITIAQWVTVFSSLDSSKPGAPIKTVAHFEFSDRRNDIWNAFALAILIVTARNYTMQFVDEMEPDEQEESDVDD
jgi:hypothetical protein